MGRKPCCSKEGLNRGAWTAMEDDILVSYINKHGEGKWGSLPKRAGLNRCGKSCRLRWLNYLRPGIKRGNISDDEEDLIVRLHRLLGNRWSLIAGRLPGRTDNEIKNYWNTTLSKKVLPPPPPGNSRSGCSNQLQAVASPKPAVRASSDVDAPPEGAEQRETGSPIRTKALRCTTVMAAAGHDHPPENAAVEETAPAEQQDFAGDHLSIGHDRPPENAAVEETAPAEQQDFAGDHLSIGHDRPPENAAVEETAPAEQQDFAGDHLSIDLDLDGIELGFLFSPWRGDADGVEAARDHHLLDDLEELLGLGDGDSHGGVPSLGDFELAELAWL